ncbi:hypothetical protein [Sphingomonas sp. DT-204]|uniref:hypothetical protein n=1 Tax=Sphingomonas sp. DT-204 TaxID=3396166 RepID=UPI003F1DE806
MSIQPGISGLHPVAGGPAAIARKVAVGEAVRHHEEDDLVFGQAIAASGVAGLLGQRSERDGWLWDFADRPL